MARRLILLLVSVIIFAGCAFEKKEVLHICPGKISSTEALTTLNAQSRNIIPFKARGRCRFVYYAEGKKSRKMRISV